MATVDVLRYYLELDTKKFVGQAKKAEKQTKRVSNAMGKMGKAVMGLAGAYLGIQGLRMAIRATTKAMADFEQGMANVNTLLNISDAQFKELNSDVLAIAETSPKAINDLTGGLYDLVSAGVSTENSMWALNEAQKAATAGSTSVKDAVKGSMGTLNAYNLGIEELTRIFDMQFNTVKRGVITFQELAMVIGRVLPSASILGLSLEEVHAAMALITKKGLDAMESASALNMTFLALADPIKQEAFEKLGFRLWDINNQFIGMDKFLKQINERIDGMSDKQRTAFFGLLKLQGRAIKGFVNMVKAADEYKNLVAEMAETGEMERALEKMRNTLTNMWKSLTSEFDVMLIKSGNRHKETLKLMISAASEFVRLIGTSTDATVQFLAVVTNAVIAMWASIETVWLTGINTILQEYARALVAIRKMPGGGLLVSDEMLIGLGKEILLNLKARNEAIQKIEDATQGTLDAGKKYLDALGDMWDHAKNIKDIFEGINKETKDIVFNLKEAAKEARKLSLIPAKPLGAAQTGLVSLVPGEIPFFQDVWNNIRLSLGKGTQVLQGAFDAIVESLDETSRRIINIATDIVLAIESKDPYAAARGMFSMMMNDIMNASRSAENFNEALVRLQEETQRNIDAIYRMTEAQKDLRIAWIQTEIQRLQIQRDQFGMTPTLRALIDETIGYLRQELEVLNETVSDDAAIKGIKSLEDLMAFIAGQEGLDAQAAQQLASTFTRLLDLSIEDQIEMWEAIRQQLINSGNATVWELLNIENRLQDLYDQAEDQQEERRQDLDPESQIMRSITMITENQANLMISVLNSIYITLRQFLDEFRGMVAGFDFRGMGGTTGGSVGPIYVTGATSAAAITESINREFRARGIKLG